MRFVSDRGWTFFVQAAGRAGTGFLGGKPSCCVVVTGLLSGAHLVISTPASLSAASLPTHARLVAQFLVMVRLSAPALAERLAAVPGVHTVDVVGVGPDASVEVHP